MLPAHISKNMEELFTTSPLGLSEGLRFLPDTERQLDRRESKIPGTEAVPNQSYKCEIFSLHMQASSLFSNLGGALSLYMGMAIVMGFEILELFADFFINFRSDIASSLNTY